MSSFPSCFPSLLPFSFWSLPLFFLYRRRRRGRCQWLGMCHCFFSICCRNEAAFTCLYCCKDIDYCLAPVPLIFERCANQRSSAADRISPEQQHYAIMLNSALLRNVIIIGCARAGKMCSSALFHRFPKPRCHSRNALRRCPLRKSIKLRPHLMQH